METWYKTKDWGDNKIVPVDVVKETTKQIVVLEKRVLFRDQKKEVQVRHAKESQNDNYFKTYQEAYDYISNKKKSLIELLENRLAQEKMNLSSFIENYKK